jgi:hypothetical protein
MMTRVINKARGKETPFSCRLTKVSAAKSSIAPWAKLSTPDVL